MTSSSEQDKSRVAHVMPWAGIGGVEIATLRMVDATRDRIAPTAFCMKGASVVQAFVERGVPVVTYEPPVPSFRHFVRFYRESRMLAARFREANVQIIHFAEIKAAFHCGLAARLAGIKRISHVRNVFPYIPWQERLLLRLAQSFIFVSKQARDFSAIPGRPTKSRVIYDAVAVPPANSGQERNTHIRQQFDIPENAPVIGMVARVNPQKDYVTLAHAAALVLEQEADTRFLIVGDNSLVDVNRDHYAEIMQLLRKLRIEHAFIFAGHRSDVDTLIQPMSFCVLPTHREGFPLSILETMAQRKAVIATEVGGIPEIVRNGENGFLVPHGDPAALAERMLFLIRNPEEARRMGQQAADLVREDYSTSKFAQEIIAAYDDLLNARSSVA